MQMGLALFQYRYAYHVYKCQRCPLKLSRDAGKIGKDQNDGKHVAVKIWKVILLGYLICNEGTPISSFI
jgi:hypothetical protein